MHTHAGSGDVVLESGLSLNRGCRQGLLSLDAAVLPRPTWLYLRISDGDGAPLMQCRRHSIRTGLLLQAKPPPPPTQLHAFSNEDRHATSKDVCGEGSLPGVEAYIYIYMYVYIYED